MKANPTKSEKRLIFWLFTPCPSSKHNTSMALVQKNWLILQISRKLWYIWKLMGNKVCLFPATSLVQYVFLQSSLIFPFSETSFFNSSEINALNYYMLIIKPSIVSFPSFYPSHLISKTPFPSFLLLFDPWLSTLPSFFWPLHSIPLLSFPYRKKKKK